MSGNCGFPDGVVHSHVEACYQAGRRELEDALRAVIAAPDDTQQWEGEPGDVRQVDVVDVDRLRALLPGTTTHDIQNPTSTGDPS